MYNKEIQTAAFDNGPTIEDLRRQLRAEYEFARQQERQQREKELEEEATKLEQEVELEIQGRQLYVRRIL